MGEMIEKNKQWKRIKQSICPIEKKYKEMELN